MIFDRDEAITKLEQSEHSLQQSEAFRNQSELNYIEEINQLKEHLVAVINIQTLS